MEAMTTSLPGSSRRRATSLLFTLSNELVAFLNVGLEFRQACIDKFLLGCIKLADGVNRLYAVAVNLDLRTEEIDTLLFVEVRVDECRCGLRDASISDGPSGLR